MTEAERLKNTSKGVLMDDTAKRCAFKVRASWLQFLSYDPHHSSGGADAKRPKESVVAGLICGVSVTQEPLHLARTHSHC